MRTVLVILALALMAGASNENTVVTTDKTSAISADESTWTDEEVAWAREAVREAHCRFEAIRDNRDAVATRAFEDAAAEAAAAGLSTSACLDAGGVAYNAVIADYADAYNAAYDAAYTNSAATAATAVAAYRARNPNAAAYAAIDADYEAAWNAIEADYEAAWAVAKAEGDAAIKAAPSRSRMEAIQACDAALEALVRERDAAIAAARDARDAAKDATSAAISASGSTPPEKVYSTEPVCPPMLKEAGWLGSCSIGLYIDELGNVGKVWVIRSTGKTEADQAAIDAAWASQWRPATRNGVPIAEKVSIIYEF